VLLSRNHSVHCNLSTPHLPTPLPSISGTYEIACTSTGDCVCGSWPSKGPLIIESWQTGGGTCAPVPACPLSTTFLLHDNTSQIANAAPSTATLPITIPAIAPGPRAAADEAGGAVEVGNMPELDLELAAGEKTGFYFCRSRYRYRYRAY
jgi:hypothetical protein